MLSGFLITNILLAAKGHDHHAVEITVFFARRAARIWPPYFLTRILLAGIRPVTTPDDAGVVAVACIVPL